MKKQFVVCFLLVLVGTPCIARDFIVEFIEENYKETQVNFSYTPLIYHSIQINSSVGPKILILTGENDTYRRWLRHYIADNKKFITQVPDQRMDEFVSAKAYEIDVTSLHPFNGKKWTKEAPKTFYQNTPQDSNHILIVDPDEKKTDLLYTVVEKMGYHARIFKTAKQAMEIFNLQPEKFKMIIAHHSILETTSDTFVDQILKINQTIPVLIDTGYKNQNTKNKFTSKFSGFRSVHIKPVIFADLQNTIETLLKKNA